MTAISVGPASESMATVPRSSRLAAVTYTLPGPVITSTGSITVPSTSTAPSASSAIALGAAGGVDLVDAEQRAGGEHVAVGPAVVVALRRRGDRDRAAPRRPAPAPRSSPRSTGTAPARPARTARPGATGTHRWVTVPPGAIAVTGSVRQLRGVPDPGARDRLGQRGPHGRVDRVGGGRRAPRRGTRSAAGRTPSNRSAASSTAAAPRSPDVLDQRPDGWRWRRRCPRRPAAARRAGRRGRRAGRSAAAWVQRKGSVGQVEPEVQRRRGVGERADRQEVDAGRGDLAGPVQGQAAGGLQQHPARSGRPAPGAPPPPCRPVEKLSSSTRSRRRRPPRRTGRGCRPRPRARCRGSRARTASIAAPTDPAAATWLSLISAASPRLIRWLTPPPQRTAYFSSARRPGSVLRVSRIRAPVPATASTQARVRGGDPGQVGQQVQRGALGGEDAGGRAGEHQRGRPGHEVAAVGDAADRQDSGRRPARVSNTAERDRTAGEHPGAPRGDVGAAELVGRDGGQRGDVRAVAQVLGQRHGRSPTATSVGGQPGASAMRRAGSVSVRPMRRPVADRRRSVADDGRRPGGPARTAPRTAARSGWSVRTWQPRDSARAAAAASSARRGQREVGRLHRPAGRRTGAAAAPARRPSTGRPAAPTSVAADAGRRGSSSPAARRGRQGRRRAPGSGSVRPVAAAPSSQFGADRRGGPLPHHQTLEQRVGRQPVRAVQAGPGDLADREQSGHGGAAVQVGEHAAAVVVRGRGDRDRVGGRVDAGQRAGRGHRREAAGEDAGRDAGRIQEDVVADAARVPVPSAGRRPATPRLAGPGRPAGAPRA